MKRRCTVAAVVAGLIAAAAGLAGAGPASAASPQDLCVVNTNVCALIEGAQDNIWMLSTGYASWLYNGPNHPGQIQLDGGLDGVSICMQLDHNAGNTVIYATCNGANYQKWAGFSAGTGLEGFRSEWDTSLCLTYNESQNYLDAVACDGKWYQEFVPYFT